MSPFGRIGSLLIASFAALQFSSSHASDPSATVLPTQGTLQAAFVPWDDVEGIIKTAIDQARRQILVHAYLLTNKKIADALISAKRRGLDVRVLADARKHADTPSSKLAALASAGVAVWLETDYENAHNKVIILDPSSPQASVITGSFNFTWTAQHRNAENILVARNNPTLAARYELNWTRHQVKAVPLKNN